MLKPGFQAKNRQKSLEMISREEIAKNDPMQK